MKKNGFTLIEILVVIVLLAAISVTIGVNMSGMTERQDEKQEKEYKKLAMNYYNDSDYQSFNISFSILEIDLNEDIDKYLGGYIE